MSAAGGGVDPAALRRTAVLADLGDAELAWFAGQCELVTLAPGETLFRVGEPASWMYVILEGAVHSRREALGPEAPVFRMERGQVSGMLPFSRMTEFAGTGRAAAPTQVARFPAAQFGEMLRRIPVLEQRLVGVMADRVREVTRIGDQTEKLMALGRLSAGLAHELNNPAAAVRRAASDLRGRLASLESFTVTLAAACASPDAVRALDAVRRVALARAGDAGGDALERSGREDGIAAWAEDVGGVAEPWTVAATLADAGFTAAELEDSLAAVPHEARAAALGWLEASVAADALLGAVEAAAARISSLVASVKTYTHMDQGRAPVTTDLRAGVESTLAMFAHKVREKRLTIEREFAPSLPPIGAFGGELNQVWTNLLDNAIDAAPVGGHVGVRTASVGRDVVVEITDDGPGVPAELRDRIWEPFFTTKAVGEGTGLGLDIARRIVVRQHGGDLALDTAAGRTRFTVRLPTQAGATFESTPIEQGGGL